MKKRNILVEENKILKLKNVIGIVLEGSEINYMDRTIDLMSHYIINEKTTRVGPLIQCISSKKGNLKGPDISVTIFQQVLDELDKCDKPYFFTKEIKVPNCFYGKYRGPKNKMQYVYEKINITAFESGVELDDKSYTVVINGEYENFEIDVFIQARR